MSTHADPAEPAAPVVEVRGLTMRYGRRLIHEDLDIGVRRGEILAIVGGSGSGKTTLLREMALLQRPSAGTVRVFGADAAVMDEAQTLRARRHIGVLFQNGALFGGMNVPRPRADR